MSPLTAQERIESIKTGLVSAGVVGLVFLGFTMLHRWGILAQVIPTGSTLGITPWVQGGLAIATGFLFGITYRYVIRTDQNPHLRTGAIAAFGLVRGFAEVDAGLLFQGNRWILFLLTGESVAMIAIAATVLNFSIHKKWLKPFLSDSYHNPQ